MMQPEKNISDLAQEVGVSASGASAKPLSTETEPAFGNGGSVVGGKGSGKTGWILGLVLLAIIAVGGIGFGVWAYMDGSAQRDALNEQINDLKNKLNNSDDTIINIDTDGEKINTAEYIYVGEWGIKIKIPENLENVSYEVVNFDSGLSAGTKLCVSGATSGHDELRPSFLYGTAENRYTDKLRVCLGKNTKFTSEEDGGSFYDTIPAGEFFIVGPQALAGDGTDGDWETESVHVITEMLEDENNRSDI